MALLYISEYADSGFISGAVAVGKEPSTGNQTIVVGAGSLQSTAFKSNTRLVRIHNDSTSPCAYRFGTNPTAVVGDARMAANQTEYFQVMPGDKVAVIATT